MRSAAGFHDRIRPCSSAAMIASLAVSATDRKRLSDSRSACSICIPAMTRPSWRPMCEATSSRRSSGVTAASEKHSITAKHRSRDRHRERQAAAQPDLGRDGVARKVRVARDVDDPLRATALEHAPRQPDATRQRRTLRPLAEALEALRVAEVPELGRRDACRARRSTRARPASPSSGRPAPRTPAAPHRPSSRGWWHPRRARSDRPARHPPDGCRLAERASVTRRGAGADHSGKAGDASFGSSRRSHKPEDRPPPPRA